METQERKLSQLDVVAVLDPARSRESEYKLLSRHAIVVTAMDWDMNIFVLYTWAKRTDLNELLTTAEEVCQMFPMLRCFGVETVAAQIVIKDVLAEWLRLNRITIPTVELKPDTRITKKWRIRMQIQRPATQGRLHLHDDQHELRTELFGFPHSRTIDLVDALGYCVGLHYPPDEWDEIPDYSVQTSNTLQRLIHDGKVDPRDVPERIAVNNAIPYANLPQLRPRLAPSLNEIFPRRGEDN